MISFSKGVKKKVEERVNDELCDVIGIIYPQVIVNERGKNFFYKTTGIEITKHSTNIEQYEDFMEMIKSSEIKLLKDLEEKINSSSIIYVENNGKPRLISTNLILEVQTVFE